MIGETHGHIFMDGINYKNAVALHKNGVDKSVVQKLAAAYQQAGIRFYRDGGDNLGVSEYARDVFQACGIDFRTPIFAIHKKGLYGGIVGKAFETTKDFCGLIKEAKTRKADFIKIMLSGIVDFSKTDTLSCPPLDFETTREIIHISHEEGFSVMVHANGQAVHNAIEAKADSIEHGYFASADCAKAMAQSGIVFVPTLVTCHNLLGCGRFPDTALDITDKGHQAFTALCHENGVLIAAGSDAGAYMVPHCSGLLDEIALLNTLGISEHELCIAQDKIQALFKYQ